MLENHMVLNTADAPWNRPDMPDWECSCGANHGYDVRTKTYPIWHSRGHFVEQCSHPDCGSRCCHECAVTCRICGCHYCSEHQKHFNQHLELCEDCGACYTNFANTVDPPDLQKLIDIERNIQRCGSVRRINPTETEIDWLIAELKEAWESLATQRKE